MGVDLERNTSCEYQVALRWPGVPYDLCLPRAGPALDQCLRLHDPRPHGTLLPAGQAARRCQGAKICSVLCLTRYYVRAQSSQSDQIRGANSLRSSFIVQLIGALATVGNNPKPSTVKLGLHIYTAGVCLQQAVILGFLVLCVLFQRRMNRESSGNVLQGNRLVLALYLSLMLITVSECRSIYVAPICKYICTYLYIVTDLPHLLFPVPYHLPHYRILGGRGLCHPQHTRQ